MLTIIKTSNKDKILRSDLNSLMVKFDTDIWIGQITKRIQRRIINNLSQKQETSIVGALSKNLCNSIFYKIENGQIFEINFFNFYENSS